MKSKSGPLAWLREWLLAACLVLFSTGLHAAIDILDSIEVEYGRTQSTVTINLNIPVRYRSHVPAREGDLLRIFLNPVPAPGVDTAALQGMETMQRSPDERIPLFEVIYDGAELSNPSIFLRFRHKVEYEIPPNPDFRTLVVKLRHREFTDSGPVAAAGTADKAAVNPTDTVADPDYRYAINLASSVEPFSAEDVPDREEFHTYHPYTTRYLKGNKTWHRLRLGFFRTRSNAAAALKRLASHYPDAWIAKVSPEEKDLALESDFSTMLAEAEVPTRVVEGITAPEPAVVQGGGDSEAVVVPAPEPADKKVVIPRKSKAAPSTDRLADLMEQANGKMVDQDYSGAVSLYTKILRYPDHEFSKEALEFLGLARERKGQLAHAKAVYKDYLERYPDGEDAERVKQRLAGLATASKTPRDKLRAKRESGKQQSKWEVFGGFSQFYRRDENTTELDENDELTTVSQSSLASDLDISARKRSADYDVRTRFTGGYLHDFLDNGSGNDSTVSSLYLDARDKQHGLSMRVGRQSRSTGGVLGRFDGLLLGASLSEKVSVHGVGGAPVESSRDGFEDSRYFYGLSLDIEGFAKGWDTNLFVIEQQVDDIIDRRAVGGELRYFQPNRSFFSLVDYDILYNELNIAQFLGNWTTEDRTTFNLTLDYRNSPVLTTNNALIGQTAATIEDLLNTYTESEIRDIALDRTAASKLATLGASRPLNDKFQLSGDITLSNFSDTDASAGVLATEGTGNEYFYNFQLIGSNLIKSGDIAIIGLRYIDANTTDTTSLSLNTRYPVTNDLRINPKFRVDFRKNQTDDTEQFIYRPSARVSWRVKRRLRLEAEAGGEWSDQEIVTGSTASRSYFINLGYRADF